MAALLGAALVLTLNIFLILQTLGVPFQDYQPHEHVRVERSPGTVQQALNVTGRGSGPPWPGREVAADAQ